MEVDRPHLLHEARQVINEGRNKPNEEVETSQLIVYCLSFSQLLISSLILSTYSVLPLSHLLNFDPTTSHLTFFIFLFQPDLTVLNTGLSFSSLLTILGVICIQV